MQPLPKSAMKVQGAARALGLDIVVRELPESTRTAVEAAAACGCELGQIVKSLVFRGGETGKAYLILVAGHNRVDEQRFAAVAGEPLERADAAFVRETTGYAIGGVPPFGHATAMTTFMDEDLLRHATVWAAAGTPRCLFSVSPAELKRALGVNAVPVC